MKYSEKMIKFPWEMTVEERNRAISDGRSEDYGDNMPKKIKIYGDVQKIGDDYYAVPYAEYWNGNLYSVGIEDFSKKRLQRQTKVFEVLKHDGRIGRDGRKYTECVGILRVGGNTCKIQAARFVYGNDVVRVG